MWCGGDVCGPKGCNFKITPVIITNNAVKGIIRRRGLTSPGPGTPVALDGQARKFIIKSL